MSKTKQINQTPQKHKRIKTQNFSYYPQSLFREMQIKAKDQDNNISKIRIKARADGSFDLCIFTLI